MCKELILKREIDGLNKSTSNHIIASRSRECPEFPVEEMP